MDLYQLATFVAVAREGSITRASEVLHLSQPAVSAHIKAIEDTLGLALFERNARGMSLTRNGERLLAKAEQTLAAHRELMDEAKRLKGRLTGKLRIGAGSNSKHAAVGSLINALAEKCPEVEVHLEHGTSREILAALRNGTLDAGFYNEPGDPDPLFTTVEVSRFSVHVVAPRGLVKKTDPPDWKALAELAWIYPASSACCGQTAESLFKANRFRPKKIVSVDREEITRALVASGTGVGLLHDATAREAEARGEVDVLAECPGAVRVLFAHLASRGNDPVVTEAVAALTAG